MKGVVDAEVSSSHDVPSWCHNINELSNKKLEMNLTPRHPGQTHDSHSKGVVSAEV